MSTARRLGATLRALITEPSAALDARSAAFGSGADVQQPPDHPIYGAAPDYWKEADLESAARFTPSGVLTPDEQSKLQRELRYFREHGCIMIPDALVGEQLERARQAYDRVLHTTWQEWEAVDPEARAKAAAGGESGVPELPGLQVLEQEDDLLALVEVPRVLPLLSQCVGEDLQCSDAFLRYNPGGGDPAGPIFRSAVSAQCTHASLSHRFAHHIDIILLSRHL